MRLCHSEMMIFADYQWILHQIPVLLLSAADSAYNQALLEHMWRDGSTDPESDDPGSCHVRNEKV